MREPCLQYTTPVVACAAACVAAQPQAAVPVKKLAIPVAVQSKTPGELRLLPGAQEAIEGDAFALYEKAVGVVAEGPRLGEDHGLEADGCKGPAAGGGRGGHCGRSRRAWRCWSRPASAANASGRVIVEDEVPPNLRACRNMVFLLSLQARYHLGRGDYPSCCGLWGQVLPWPGI